MEKGFWGKLKRPIIGLAPMDGVTDASFRYIVDEYGKPDVLFTEFTSVEGICYGAHQLLSAFIHHKTSTPTIGQIFGSDPASFYKVAFVLGELGFDGIDINMGCPDPHVAKKGGGAGLILTPGIAQEIVLQTRKGIQDWANGKRIETLDLRSSILDWIKNYQKQYDLKPEKRELPVSVKTRIGYEEIVTEDWMFALLDVKPAAITLHGRTLKQLYSGESNWEEIGKAAKMVKKTETLFLGNGDIKSLADAKEKIKTYGVDGVLIGRASFGNPWVFTEETADLSLRFKTAVEHCRIFQKLTPQAHFLSLRKHMGWYCKGFEGAAATRVRLMQVQSLKEVEEIIGSVS
jgi:tRNA-dihydrouridine synthase B